MYVFAEYFRLVTETFLSLRVKRSSSKNDSYVQVIFDRFEDNTLARHEVIDIKTESLRTNSIIKM